MAQEVVHADDVVDNSRIGVLNVLVAVLCGTVLAVDGFDTQAIGYVAPQLTKMWHVPPDLLGYLFSSAIVGLMVGYLLISPLAVRFGPKRVSMLCVASFGVLTMLCATASGPWELMAYRFLTGIGLGGAIPPAVALCGEYAPKRLRSTYITFSYLGLTLGQVAAGGVSLGLLQSYGWQSVLIVGGVVPVLYALLMWLLMPESLEYRISRNDPKRDVAHTMRRIDPTLALAPDTRFVVGPHASQGGSVAKLFHANRGFGTAMLWVALFMNLGVNFFLQNWLPTIFESNGMSLNEAIAATTTAMSGGIVAAFLVGPLMDRFGAYVVMTLMFLIGGLFLALVGVTNVSARALMIAAGFVAAGCVSGNQKSANALCILFYPTSLRSTGLGWGLGIGRIGAIIAPSLAGALFKAHWSAQSVFYTFAVPMLVGGAAMFAMGRFYQAGPGKAALRAAEL